MSLLKNKIAVVTGGSSGIGLATAKRFVEEGAYVFIAGRRQAEIDKAVAEIGKNVTGVKTDVSELDDLDRLYDAFLDLRLGDNASNEAKFRELRPYSVRKACIGSRREARQAGKMQANEATKRRVRITAPITAGSVGLVP
jgi:NAD(P)-dependent dehydrogenase (short-subunit alcohol dehydrogenase family)